MADIEAVTAAIESIAPPYLAEEWDNSGFQIRCLQRRTDQTDTGQPGDFG